MELLDSVFFDSVPIASRLMKMLEVRGWTKLERIGGSLRVAPHRDNP